jgi:hypothetical protein
MSVTLMVMSLPMLGQGEGYKAEIFGGYQYTRVGGGDGANFNGWNASATGNLNDWFGVTGDISGAYKSESAAHLHLHNFLFGPTVSYNKAAKVKPFAHALFGMSHANAGISGLARGSENAFAMALGGGIDVGVGRNFAVRLFQADYLMTHFGGEKQNNARISVGLVARF